MTSAWPSCQHSLASSFPSGNFLCQTTVLARVIPITKPQMKRRCSKSLLPLSYSYFLQYLIQRPHTLEPSPLLHRPGALHRNALFFGMRSFRWIYVIQRSSLIYGLSRNRNTIKKEELYYYLIITHFHNPEEFQKQVYHCDIWQWGIFPEWPAWDVACTGNLIVWNQTFIISWVTGSR